MPDYTSKGIQYPVPSDRIKDGNVVAKLADDIKALANTANTAVSESVVEATQGKMVLSASAINYKDMQPGVHYPITATAATTMGLPTASSGYLVIHHGYTAANGEQTKTVRWYPADGTGNVWSSDRIVESAGWAFGWYTGSRAAAKVLRTADAPATGRASLPPAYYTFVTGTAATAFGMPRASQGDLLVSWGYQGNNESWTFYPTDNPTEVWVQVKKSGVWGSWEMRGGGGSNVERETRVAEFRARYGGRYGTSGKACLALVFDHGTNNFIAKVLPILKKYGVPATIGLNSQMYNPDYTFYGTDSNTTFASLQTDFVNNGISVWNHGRLHKPTSQPPNLEIVGGRDELKSSLPMIPIDGWLHTGEYGAFNSGSSFAAYRDNSIGALIMNAHAVGTGNIQEPIKGLSGDIKIGFDGEWLDSGATPIANVKGLIQRAQKVGGGVMTRQHPQFLDEAGYLTTAQLDEFIGWCATERDSGRLIIMTGDLMNLANAGGSHRRNLVDGTGGVGNQTRSISLADNTLAAGSVNELHAVVRLSVAGSVRLTAAGTGLSMSRTIDVPANTWKEVRSFFTIPLTATGTLTVNVELATGSGLSVHQLNVYPG